MKTLIIILMLVSSEAMAKSTREIFNVDDYTCVKVEEFGRIALSCFPTFLNKSCNLKSK